MFFCAFNLFGQEKLKTSFYSFYVPENSEAKFFNSSREEFANTDVYEFKESNKPKYLLYLISNKLTEDYNPLNIENHLNYLTDIENAEIISSEVIENGKIQVKFKYIDNEQIMGIIFLTSTNNILNRFLFLFPNSELSKKFSEEVKNIFLNIEFNKKYWD